MRMKFYPEDDMFSIRLLDTPPPYSEGEDVADGVLLFRNEEGQIIGLEIDNASRRVDLTDIRKKPSLVFGGESIYSVQEAAEQLKIAVRTVQLVIKKMGEAGHQIGKQRAPHCPILLSQTNVEAIQRWREEHPSGRPSRVGNPT